MPPNLKFGGDTATLAGSLWHHFQRELARVDYEESLHDFKLENPGHDHNEPTGIVQREASDYKIVDINFGKRTENDSK